MHDESPTYISDLLEVYKPKRELRSANKTVSLTVPICRLVRYGDRSFMHAALKLWNSLPSDVRDADTLASFKKRLKTHFCKQLY